MNIESPVGNVACKRLQPIACLRWLLFIDFLVYLIYIPIYLSRSKSYTVIMIFYL